MATRLPRKVKLLEYEIEVRQVSKEDLRDVVGDHDGADGAWDDDLRVIFVARHLTRKEKRQTFLHELQHALIDLLAREMQ